MSYRACWDCVVCAMRVGWLYGYQMDMDVWQRGKGKDNIARPSVLALHHSRLRCIYGGNIDHVKFIKTLSSGLPPGVSPPPCSPAFPLVQITDLLGVRQLATHWHCSDSIERMSSPGVAWLVSSRQAFVRPLRFENAQCTVGTIFGLDTT